MPTPRSHAMRKRMEIHVADRLEKVRRKWAGRTDASARQILKKAEEKYRLNEILQKGIKASHQIAVATHIAKGIHPDLEVKKTTNLHIQPDALPSHVEVGSHLLAQNESIADTTGNGAYNAAAYELYLLLNLWFENQRLYQWLDAHDKDALLAFSQPDFQQNEISQWVTGLIGLMKVKNSIPATDTRARQVYWLTGHNAADDAAYHLLAPLYPSALVHAAYGIIHEDRFGDSNREVRQAYYKNEPHDGVFYDYPNLAIRKLGGSKPHNISHQNSERGGINYLLPSLPPHWAPSHLRPLRRSKDVWDTFLYFKNVRTLVKALATLLLSRPKDNMKTRITREGIEQALGAQLAVFSEWVQEKSSPGWTRDADCALELSEKLWLDPQRVELSQCIQDDESFQAAYHWGNWPDEIAGLFSTWLNQQLRKAGLDNVGDAEYLHWARQAVINVAWPVPMQRRAPEKNPEQAGDKI